MSETRQILRGAMRLCLSHPIGCACKGCCDVYERFAPTETVEQDDLGTSEKTAVEARESGARPGHDEKLLVPDGWKPIMVDALTEGWPNEMPLENPWEHLHPWYGECDAMGEGGNCAECEYVIACLARVARAYLSHAPETVEQESPGARKTGPHESLYGETVEHGEDKVSLAQDEDAGKVQLAGDDIVERLREVEKWNRGRVDDISGETCDNLADFFGEAADEIERLRARLGCPECGGVVSCKTCGLEMET